MTETSRTQRLSDFEAQQLLASLPGWQLGSAPQAITRRFRFSDFEAALDFVNRIAYLANADDHHPDLKLGYGYCEVLFTSHDAGGLTERDAKSARAVQNLAGELSAAPAAPGALAWDSIPIETVNPSMTRRVVHGQRLTLARMRFKAGFRVPQHQHVQEQITQVDSGHMRFWFGADRAQVLDLGPGELVVIPSNLPHEALCLDDVEETDLWTPRREDWLNGSDAYLRG